MRTQSLEFLEKYLHLNNYKYEFVSGYCCFDMIIYYKDFEFYVCINELDDFNFAVDLKGYLDLDFKYDYKKVILKDNNGKIIFNNLKLFNFRYFNLNVIELIKLISNYIKCYEEYGFILEDNIPNIKIKYINDYINKNIKKNYEQLSLFDTIN